MGKAGSNKITEVDARRPVSTHKVAIQCAPEPVRRDPRFSEMSGKLNDGLYEASYNFLDDMRQKEEKQLRSDLKRYSTAKKPEAVAHREKLRAEFHEVKSAKRDKAAKESARKLKREWRKTEQAAVAKGKQPFFLKKGAKKEAELKEKFNQLKKAGKLDTYLQKQRKRQALSDAAMAPELSTFAPSKR
eukprot:TRINITY_DN6178_c0_g1_i1.p2 TRINITY_DN6178_c0_g1~~TRINITY_DN6178_c0_g1_i1.p2  ORF type:complete len:188 (+),score=88.15 TRINITY_DN6178_c0_g1_i1:126-689(+)